MTLRSSAMALVNAAHRSLVRLSLTPSPQELRRPRFSFCLYLSNSTAPEKQPLLPTKSAAKPNVPVKRSRAAPPAAAPSRWPLYRGTPEPLSTTQMKVFRQKWISACKWRDFNGLDFIRQTEPGKSDRFHPDCHSGRFAPDGSRST